MINVENDTEDYEKYCINKLDMQKIPLIWKKIIIINTIK